MRTNFQKDQESILQEAGPDEWQNGVQTGIWENTKARWQRTKREDLWASAFTNMLRGDGVVENPSASQNVRRLIREGKIDEDAAKTLLYTPPEWLDEEPSIDEQKAEGYLDVFHPEEKYDKMADRASRKKKLFEIERAEEEEVFGRASTAASVVSALASTPLYIVDPPNLAAMAVGPFGQLGRAGRLAQYSALALEQVAVEAVTAATVWETKKALGVPYGSKDVLMNMGGAVVGGAGLLGTVDVAKSLAKNIKAIKMSKAASTVEGQKAINTLEHAAAEVEIARQSGRPLGDVLDETDTAMERILTPTPGKNVSDPGEFPEIKGYDDDLKLQEDYDQLMAERAGKEAPIGDEAAGVEYKYSDPVIEDFDAEIEKTLMARACYGG